MARDLGPRHPDDSAPLQEAQDQIEALVRQWLTSDDDDDDDN